MTGIEYMNTVCPTTSAGRDPNREDVADAFEDGVAEGYKHHWKPSEDQMKWLKDVIETVPMTCRQQVPLESLYNDLLKLM